MPSIDEIKNKKFCKFHRIVDHFTNNCVHFRDLIQKAIKDRRLKFKEKSAPMKVDTESFDANSNYVELVTLPIGMDGFHNQEADERKLQDDLSLNLFENTKKPIYPKLREDLLDFLFNQRDGNANVAMCPHCIVVLNRNVAIIYGK